MGAQDSESTSLTDEDVCHELEGATRGSAGEYQADERAGVARLIWRVSG